MNNDRLSRRSAARAGAKPSNSRSVKETACHSSS